MLEVIAKAEVAQHFKKHQVTLCAADIIKVIVFATSADTFLHGDCSVIGSNFITHEVRLERHHAGHSEEQCGVVRDEAGRRDDRVRSVVKELRESGPQLVCAAGRTGRKW